MITGMNGAIGTSWSIPMRLPIDPPLANSVMTPKAAPIDSRFMIPALSDISGEWKAKSRSRNERPMIPKKNTGSRAAM